MRVGEAIVAVLLVVPFLPLAAADAPFVTRWDDGGAAWSIDGATLECDAWAPGCVLEIAPPCCGTAVGASASSVLVSAPIGNGIVLSYFVLGSDTSSDTDTWVDVVLDHDGELMATTTDEWSPNSRVSLFSQGYGDSRDFARWEAAGEWYQVRVHIDAQADLAYAELRDADGATLGVGQPVEIPAESTTVTALRIGGMTWSTLSSVHWYGTVCLGTAPLPAACDEPPGPAYGLHPTPRAPVAHPADDPLRHDDVRVRVLAPNGADVCYEAVHRFGGEATTCLTMFRSDEPWFEAHLPRLCAGTEVVYTAVVRLHSEGTATPSGSFVMGGTPVLGEHECLPEDVYLGT